MIQEVVIVGGGFGGVRVAKLLSRWGRDIHITLIDKNRYHTFHPALYEVATADIPEPFAKQFSDFGELRSSAAYSLEDIFLNDLNVTFKEDELVSLDARKKELTLKNSPLHRYDILVLALGSETEYFNIPGLRARGLSLKSVMEAMTVRDAIDEAFARAPKHRRISIMIGGGGFTGCELAGEMIGYMKDLARIHGRSANNAECIIVEASKNLLGGASPWIQKKAAARLKKLGVRILLESAVAEAEEKSVVLKNGERVFFDVLVWTAGVSVCRLVQEMEGLEKEKRGQFTVDAMLHARPHEDIFALGDAACVVSPKTRAPLPMTASNAIREAWYAAENIKRTILKRPMLPFAAGNTRFVIPLGGRYALLESGRFRMSGFLPWVIKQLIEIHYWWTVVGLVKAFRIWRLGIRIFIRND